MPVPAATDVDPILASLGVEAKPTGDDARALDVAGHTVVHDVLRSDEVAAIQNRIAELLVLAPGENPMWRPRATLHLDGLIARGAVFDATWRSPRVLSAVAHLLGSDFWVTELAYRAPAPGHGAQALHRLGPMYADADRHPLATVIFPLVDFTAENGATRVIAGSHLEHLAVSDRADAVHPGEQRVACRAGSAIVFTEHLFHSGTTNDSDRRREALIATYARRGLPTGHHALTIDNATVDRLGDAALLLVP